MQNVARGQPNIIWLAEWCHAKRSDVLLRDNVMLAQVDFFRVPQPTIGNGLGNKSSFTKQTQIPQHALVCFRSLRFCSCFCSNKLRWRRALRERYSSWRAQTPTSCTANQLQCNFIRLNNLGTMHVNDWELVHQVFAMSHTARADVANLFRLIISRWHLIERRWLHHDECSSKR